MSNKWPAIKAGNLNRALNKALIQKLIAGTAAGICLTGTPRGKRDIIIYIQQSERNGLQQQAFPGYKPPGSRMVCSFFFEEQQWQQLITSRADMATRPLYRKNVQPRFVPLHSRHARAPRALYNCPKKYRLPKTQHSSAAREY
jgi:hypothetical protein